jgi:methylamine dehydrogenase heavy chain
MIGAGHMATFLQSRERNELYVAESFYTRRTRGERTDAIQIYDTTNLAYQAEIVLPGGKRAQTVTQKSGFQFTDGERLGLVFNFTPAASVTVVDFEQREVLSQIDTPGCSLIYPTGKRGFSMLCGDGGMTTFNLDEKGAVSKETRTEKFNEIEDDPLFMKTAIIDGVNYFVSFKGRVQPIDLQGEKARVLKGWSLLSEAEKKANWRPAGWHVINSDRQGRLYVLMQADGHEGSHKNGGGEVWVYDVKKKQRIRKLTLANHGISIEVTKGETPYLAVINANFEFDVYEADSGKHLRTIGGRTAETPFVMHAAQ